MKLDEGYSMYSIHNNKDNDGVVVIQIKTEFINRFVGMFEVEENCNTWTHEGVVEEVNNIKDFAIGALGDLIRDNAFKKETLTHAEFAKRYDK